MPKLTPTTEREWGERIKEILATTEREYQGLKIYHEPTYDALVVFIRTLLKKTATEARAEAIEKAIEAIGEDAKYIAEGDLGYPEENRWVDGFNLANDEIRQRLNQLKEGK